MSMRRLLLGMIKLSRCYVSAHSHLEMYTYLWSLRYTGTGVTLISMYITGKITIAMSGERVKLDQTENLTS